MHTVQIDRVRHQEEARRHQIDVARAKMRSRRIEVDGRRHQDDVVRMQDDVDGPSPRRAPIAKGTHRSTTDPTRRTIDRDGFRTRPTRMLTDLACRRDHTRVVQNHLTRCSSFGESGALDRTRFSPGAHSYPFYRR